VNQVNYRIRSGIKSVIEKEREVNGRKKGDELPKVGIAVKDSLEAK
jgi:hypothetical protein